MLHVTARARPGRLLFATWPEGLALWAAVVAAAPGLAALVVMPDHLHLLHERDVRLDLASALSGYARWRNARLGTRGPLLRPLSEPETVLEGGAIRRSVRRVHLDPCRARLVHDPLAWPLSTHRDAVGLAATPAVSVASDPAAFHACVSSDPTVKVDGTPLPSVTVAVPDPGAVLAATSAFARVPVGDLDRRGPARTLYVGAARALTLASHAAVGAAVGLGRDAVRRTPVLRGERVGAIARIVGDDRFPALLDGDLRRRREWWRYRDLV